MDGLLQIRYFSNCHRSLLMCHFCFLWRLRGEHRRCTEVRVTNSIENVVLGSTSLAGRRIRQWSVGKYRWHDGATDWTSSFGGAV